MAMEMYRKIGLWHLARVAPSRWIVPRTCSNLGYSRLHRSNLTFSPSKKNKNKIFFFGRRETNDRLAAWRKRNSFFSFVFIIVPPTPKILDSWKPLTYTIRGLQWQFLRLISLLHRRKIDNNYWKPYICMCVSSYSIGLPKGGSKIFYLCSRGE